MDRLGDLELQANACLPEIRLHSIEPRVFIEGHHTRVELLNDIGHVHFGGFLAEARVRGGDVGYYQPIGKLRYRELA